MPMDMGEVPLDAPMPAAPEINVPAAPVEDSLSDDEKNKWDSILTNSMGSQVLCQTVTHSIDLVREEYSTAICGIKDSYANDVDSMTETEDLYIDL